MASYGNGLDTKEKILKTAKKLFYEKGYDNTTFKEISTISGINQGLIVYHYKTKANLAAAVFREYIKTSMKKIEDCFPDVDNLTLYFINDYVYFRLIYEDVSFRNFMNVCCGNGFLNKEENAVNDETYLVYFWELTDSMTDDMGPDADLLEAILVAYEGLKNNYTCHICKNYERFSVREASENYIYIYCRLFGISEEHYGERMMAAQVLTNQTALSIRNFDFDISPIKRKKEKKKNSGKVTQ